MKKLITILFVLIAFIAQSQDTKPNNPELKKLIAPNTPIFYFNPIDSAVWIFKGTYGWTKLADSARVYKELAKKENISNKVISISGASTNIQYPSAKLLYDQLALKEPTQTKGNLTESVTGLQFNATRQVIGGAADLSLSSGYVIPTTTDVANWNSASSDTRVKATLIEATTGTDDTKYITPLKLIDVGKLLYVPYVNATDNINLGTFGLTGDSIKADVITLANTNIITTINNKVADVITDGVTTVAPSQNAVFDALALKLPVSNPTATGVLTTPNLTLTGSGFNNSGYGLRVNGGGVVYAEALTASQVYKGTWNADTNTPTLANGTGTSGWYYRVTVAGTVNFGAGNITFSVGDDVSYNGSIWERIPAATIMGNPLTKTDDTNVTLTLGGSPETALVNAASITAGWTGTLADSRITSSGNWNTAYNDKVNSLAVTGDATKTITLTQQDGGTVYGTFTDNNTTYDLSPYRLKSDTVLLSGTASNYDVSLKENILTFGTGLNRTGNTITNTITQFTTANEIDPKYAADSSYIKSHIRNDLDLSPTNELQTISTTGAAGNITLSNSGGTLNLNVNDADSDPTNELQTLSKIGSTISLSGGGGSVTDDNTTYSAGTGMSLVGTTFNNTAPDQVVSLTQGGATTITGTYPNFTISSPSEQYSGTVISVFAGNGLTQTGTATINPTINVNSHAGSSGTIGTVNIGADAIGVNLGNTSITAMRGDYGTDAYNGRISSLTTTGSSGASTFTSNILNIPNYTLSGLGGQTQLNGTGFVKASGTTISYDNSTYEPAFSKNTAFNKNFGTTSGTVLEGRTFGTAANNNTGDFEPAFSKNTGFNKNFGSVSGTVLEGRTFGDAANSGIATLVESATGTDTSKVITPLSLIDVTKLINVPYVNAVDNLYLGSYSIQADTAIFNTLIGTGDRVVLTSSTGQLKAGVGSFGSGDVANWNTAYNDKINSLEFTGTTTKTLTLTQQDGGTVSGNFTDDNTTYSAGTGMSLVGTTFNNTAPNIVNTSMSWNNSTNTISVTDAGGAKSVVITGFVESLPTEVYNEIPSGTPNSSLLNFTTANTPISSTVTVYLNGLKQRRTTDYTISGNTITFVLAPITGDIVMTDYKY